MNRSRLTPLARADLFERAAYLEARRRGYGQRLHAAFKRTVRRIVRSPESIARYDVRHPSLSEMRVTPIDDFKNLLVLFRIEEQVVEVLRIVHAAQDIESLADDILPE